MLVTLGLTPALQRVMLFDRVAAGEVNRAREVHGCAAGKAINAARAAKLLEPDREVVALRPAAEAPDLLATLLSPTGVLDPFAARPPAQPLRTCVTLIERSTGGVTELIEESAPVREAALGALLASLREGAPATCVAAGTLSPGSPDDFYAQAVSASPQAAWVIDAKGPALLTALAAPGGKARVAKLNTGELAQSAHTADVARGIRILHDTGATHVIVTDGASQIFASDGVRIERFKPPRVSVLNTTGCGDCLAGVFAMALDRGDDFFSAVRLAMAASAASAETLLPSVFDPARLKQLL